MKKIKINFVDLWEDFDKEDNFITRLLKEKYDVILSDEPDFLFYSCFGQNFKKYYNSCVKIFFTYENVVPNFNECDYAWGFDYINFEDRYLRYNIFSKDLKKLSNARNEISSDLLNRKFCNFIYSNATSGEGALLRQEFCKQLIKYKLVDCPGTVLNNMENAIEPRNGDWTKGKLDFIRNYKFSIAFENSSSIGYTTEKLVHPLIANSIPIYWGNPAVVRDFNSKAFINCNDYGNDFDRIIEKVIELDNDDDLYIKMVSQPILQESIKLDSDLLLQEFLINIVEKGNKPFFKDSRQFGRTELNIPVTENSLIENLFSIKTEYGTTKKRKIITTLGIKIKL